MTIWRNESNKSKKKRLQSPNSMKWTIYLLLFICYLHIYRIDYYMTLFIQRPNGILHKIIFCFCFEEEICFVWLKEEYCSPLTWNPFINKQLNRGRDKMKAYKNKWKALTFQNDQKLFWMTMPTKQWTIFQTEAQLELIIFLSFHFLFSLWQNDDEIEIPISPLRDDIKGIQRKDTFDWERAHGTIFTVHSFNEKTREPNHVGKGSFKHSFRFRLDKSTTKNSSFQFKCVTYCLLLSTKECFHLKEWGKSYYWKNYLWIKVLFTLRVIKIN